MNKKVLRIIGGVLQIIAGAIWLTIILVINKLSNKGYLELACAISLVLIGINVCAGRLKKDYDVIVYGILDLGLIVVQFVFGTYLGMGTIPMVLLLISAILFFVSKPSKTDKMDNNDTNNDDKNKE